MRSSASVFKFLHRGKDRTALLIPGWAADYRIFSSLDLDFNYLVPVKFSPSGFEEGVLQEMKENGLKAVSVIAWSMGCFAACDFAARHMDKVQNIILISARGRYPEDEIENVRKLLERSRTAFLYKFYNNCFFADEKKERLWFKNTLLKPYLDDMSLGFLLDGLDYLGQARIVPQLLDNMRAKIVHGREDKIAPFDEAFSLKEGWPGAEFIPMEKAGHMPFLKEGFRKIFDDDARQ